MGESRLQELVSLVINLMEKHWDLYDEGVAFDVVRFGRSVSVELDDDPDAMRRTVYFIDRGDGHPRILTITQIENYGRKITRATEMEVERAVRRIFDYLKKRLVPLLDETVARQATIWLKANIKEVTGREVGG